MIQVWKRKRELSSGFNKQTSSTEHAYFPIPQLNTYTKGSYYFYHRTCFYNDSCVSLKGCFLSSVKPV